MEQSAWGVRDKDGEWHPEELPKLAPVFSLPWKPKAVFKYLFGFGGLLVPFNLFYLGLAVVAYLFLTPSLETTKTFSFGWMALLYLRNAMFMLLYFGAYHYRLYTKKAQGMKYKYSDKWQAVGDKRFLFGNQVWDNMFYSLVSGGLVWTGFEALTLWAFSNKIIPYVSWREHPIYNSVLLFLIIWIRETHFYWVHRFIHWKPLYKPVHALHHRNVNVGPWSGMSMHPIEHLFYLSGVFLHWIIPSHPIHAVAHLLHASISPAKGHSGFNKIILSGLDDPEKERALKLGNYLHYLHHRYFTVNYSNDAVPWDKWLGSWHDGSPEAHAAMLARRKRTSKQSAE